MLDTAFAATLAKAQDGDQAAFAAIFRDVQPVLLRYLSVIVPEAADDVAGETWLNVVAGLPNFRGDERGFRAWLFTIARHRATDWGRSRARRYPAAIAESSRARSADRTRHRRRRAGADVHPGSAGSDRVAAQGPG